MTEVKVGQVWKHVHTGKEYKVIYIGEYGATIADAHGALNEARWKFDHAIYSLVSAPPLSDLEVVRNALMSANEDKYCSLTFYEDQKWDVEAEQDDALPSVVAEGVGVESLLTWAKTTIGVE